MDDNFITKEDLKEVFDQLMQRFEDRIVRKLPGLKKTYTIKEFCSETGLDVRTVHAYCVNGQIKATQIKKGGSWMIRSSELDRILDESEESHRNEVARTKNRNSIIHQTRNPKTPKL